MTSFVHTEFPTTHPGVTRFESVVAMVQSVGRRFDSARGLAAFLLAASVSALLVVANEVMEAWTDGHLLAAWIALWAIGFAALGLLATPTRRVARSFGPRLAAWRAKRRALDQDRRLWNLALQDARVMAEISSAMSRGAV